MERSYEQWFEYRYKILVGWSKLLLTSGQTDKQDVVERQRNGKPVHLSSHPVTREKERDNRIDLLSFL